MPSKNKEKDKLFEKLPTNVKPTHYHVSLKPDLDTFVIDGSVSVYLDVAKKSNTIVLNIADSTVSKALWETDVPPKTKQDASEFAMSEEHETLTIKFNPPIHPGKGCLHLHFKSKIQDKLKGCYRSKYNGPNGEVRYNAVTQFQSIDARRCFPCWDEPGIKSTFAIDLTVPKNLTALSNMPIKATIPHKTNLNLHTVEFKTTPIMSTYLVAFAVGEYEFIESTEDGVINRVYTGPGKKEQGQFALRTSTRVMTFYHDYFGIPYPLPKVDLIAVTDFSGGAMENWGLITYREVAVLVDPKETSASNRQGIAIIIAHEAAHQWFGNLVTMGWWNDLWLNEGFASFAQYLSTDHLYPQFDVWSQFVTDILGSALKLDALSSSHPIEVPIHHPSEIDEAFDNISYNKGASVIRMLYYYVGDKSFKKGMNIYLNRFKYANANTVDLWKALEEASGKPISKVMSTWTKQMGFPLITVASVAGKHGEENKWHLKVTQDKFYSSPVATEDKKNKDYHWMVPLTFTSGQDPKKTCYEALMDKKTMIITLPSIAKSNWVKLNSKSVGFYRVCYPPEMITQFIPAIRSRTMHPSDRLAILSDLTAMVQAGLKPTTEILQLLESYIDEDDFSCWKVINETVGKLDQILAYSDKHSKFKAFAKKIFRKITEKVGWDKKDNEGHKDALLRTLVINRMISLGDETVVQEAKTRFVQFAQTNVPIPPDIRSAVYSGALVDEPVEMIDTFIAFYKQNERLEEKERIAGSFHVVKDKVLVEKYLQFSFSEDVRSQDAPKLIKAVCQTKEGREVAWSFFKKHWEMVKYRYNGFLLIFLMQDLIENFASGEKAREIDDFFHTHKIPGSERAVQQALENVRVNEAWLKRDFREIEKFLANF